MLHIEGFVGQVGVESVHLAGNQVIDVVAAGLELDQCRVDAFAAEHGLEVGIGLRVHQHHLLADQIVNGFDIGIAAGQQHRRRVLEDYRQGHQWFALETLVEQLTVGFGILGAPGQHFIHWRLAWCPFMQAHLEAFLAVIALGNSGVVAGELELMLPAQLKVDDLQG